MSEPRSLQPRYRWTVLAVGSGAVAAFAMFRLGLPVIAPELRAHADLTLTQIGSAFSAIALGILLGLFPSGMLMDYVGERAVLTIGLTGTAGALVATAFAPGYETLLVCLLAAGFLGAGANSAGGRAVMGWFGASERGLALGIRQMALPLGGGIAALVLPPIAALGGARLALLTLAGLALAAAVAVGAGMREPPARLSLSAPATATTPLRDPRSWMLGAASFLLVVGQSSLLAFVVLFLHDARGISAGAAGALLAVLQLVGAAARPIAGILSDRGEHRRIRLLRHIALATAGAEAAVALTADGPGSLLYPLLLAAGITSLCWNGLAFTAAAELAGHARAGTALSLQSMLVLLGSTVAPLGFAATVNAVSWGAAFGGCAAAALLAHAVLSRIDSSDTAA